MSCILRAKAVWARHDFFKAPHGKGHGNADAVRQFTIKPDDNDVRLDRWFKRHLPEVGFAMVSRWARTGQIRVDGKRADVDTRLPPARCCACRPPVARCPAWAARPRTRKPLTEEQIQLAESIVLEQDRAAIVINKPPGLATQGGSGTHEHVDGLLDAYAPDNAPRPRLVHRLDKDTSGVLLVARTPGSAAFFSKRFSGRTARKIYWALVMGVPDIHDGMIELPLAKQPGTGGEKMMVDESEHGLPSRTRYRVIDRAGNRAAWVELQPFTGRTHQLRVHMAAIGHPIVGDGKYGGQAAFLSGSISRKLHLHARRLRIEHPEGDLIDVTAPCPSISPRAWSNWALPKAKATCRSKRRCWSIPRRRKSAWPRPTPSNIARNAGANAASAPMARRPAAAASPPGSAPRSSASPLESLPESPHQSWPQGCQPQACRTESGRQARRASRAGQGTLGQGACQAMTLRLAIFDCDGTLVDSQADIGAAMDGAFHAMGLVPPPRSDPAYRRAFADRGDAPSASRRRRADPRDADPGLQGRSAPGAKRAWWASRSMTALPRWWRIWCIAAGCWAWPPARATGAWPTA
jgi:23S rRNA pseudouridine955/2504/2580 synthase